MMMIKEINGDNIQGGEDHKNTDIITISLPISVINNVYALGANKTQLFKTKVLFLLWLINRGDKSTGLNAFIANNYQINVNAHRKIFTTRGELEKLRSWLIEMEFIQKIGGYKEGEYSQSYKVIKSWEHKSKNTELIHLDINEYTFARHFQDMNYVVTLKPVVRKERVKEESKLSTIMDEIKILKEELQAKDAIIKDLQQQINNKPVVVSESLLIDEPVISFTQATDDVPSTYEGIRKHMIDYMVDYKGNDKQEFYSAEQSKLMKRISDTHGSTVILPLFKETANLYYELLRTREI